jgi:hypothetical protein
MLIGTLLIIFHTWQRWSGRKYIERKNLNVSEGTVINECSRVTVAVSMKIMPYRYTEQNHNETF